MAYESRHRHRVEEPWSTPNLAANNHPYPPVSFNASASTIYDKPNANLASATTLGRDITRTPSPTPSEKKELKTGAFDWETLGKWRFWIRKEWIWYYVALIILTTITVLISLYHEEIVEWLTPATRWLHDLSFGWTVPIGILFVLSFPPLFGHEIVAILCGLVWGLWIGFGIVSAGTFLGEVGNFYAFKWCCRARGEKMERTKITYACLAKVVRDGGFKIALIARLSAIPGHFTTAVFSTCGMGIIVFSLAAILSLPKQFITVYLGVMIEQSARGETDTKSRIISNVVLALTFLITIAAMWYIYRQMNKVKPEVIYERRKARQAKLAQGIASPYNFNNSSEVLPNTSEVHIPLTSPNPRYGTPSTIVYAPSPANGYEYKPSNNYGYSKSDDADDLSSSNHSRQGAEVGWDAHPAPKTPPGIISSPQPQYASDVYAYPPAPRTIQTAQPQTPTTARSGGYADDPRYSSDIAYASPFEDPVYPRVDHRGRGHHEAEPTGMSYHTAREPSPPPTYAM